MLPEAVTAGEAGRKQQGKSKRRSSRDRLRLHLHTTHTACLTKYSSFNDYSRFLYKMLLVPVHEPKEYVQTNPL